MKKFTSIILGLILIAAGIIFGLNAFGKTDINIFFDGWWTLFIIIPCFIGLVNDKDKSGSIAGLILGILLLLAAQDVFDFDNVWKLIVPFIIILIGLKLIFKDTFSHQKEVAHKTDEPEKEFMSAFQTQTVDCSGEKIKAAKLGAVFGGIKCNLHVAEIEDGSEIDLFCAFGGAEITVPENVNVKISAFCLFGGIADKRSRHSIDENAVTLHINGCCLFGGADIK